MGCGRRLAQPCSSPFLLLTTWLSCCVCFQANIAEVEVSIPAKLHNSLIGAKGRLIRSIMEECGGVHIHFPVEGSGSDTVVIRGPSSDVEKAKKQLLHLAEEKVSSTWEGRAWGLFLAGNVLSLWWETPRPAAPAAGQDTEIPVRLLVLAVTEGPVPA